MIALRMVINCDRCDHTHFDMPIPAGKINKSLALELARKAMAKAGWRYEERMNRDICPLCVYTETHPDVWTHKADPKDAMRLEEGREDE